MSVRERIEGTYESQSDNNFHVFSSFSLPPLDFFSFLFFFFYPQNLGWNLPWLQETTVLLMRSWLNLSRDPRAVKAAMGQAIIMAIIVGFLFFQLGHNQNNVRDRYSVLFFILLNQSFTIVSQSAALFHQEKVQ